MGIKGTGYLSKKGFEWNETRSLILRRRLQILVHSNLYYRKDISLVPDSTFDSWCRELVELQTSFPNIASRVDYHNHFKDFTGETGMDLPYLLPEIEAKVELLLYKRPKIEVGKIVVDNKKSKCYTKIVLKKRNKKTKKRK